jgi:hypothetical protein
MQRRNESMKLSIKKLKNQFKACDHGIEAYKKAGCPSTVEETVKLCIKSKEKTNLIYANWLITKCFNKKQNVQYAIFAAESVLSIFENKYPKDQRPQIAINSAKDYLKNCCKKTKYAAANAAYAATYAADAATYAANAAAYAAAYTDDDAASAANAAAYAAYAANAAAYTADAATYAANAAANAAYAAYAAYAADYDAYAVRIKILNYGLTLIK